MTATLGESPSNGDSGTLARNDDQIVCCGSFNGFGADDTRGDLECGTGVVIIGVVDDFGILQVPEPNAQTSCAT